INIAGTGCLGPGTSCRPVGETLNGVKYTGAMHLRASTASCGIAGVTCTLQSALANGQYAYIANALNTLNYNRTAAFPGNSGLPVIPTSVQGAVLRYNNFSENFISANPQFSTIGLRTNLNNSNYHAMQAQFTIRPKSSGPIQGISYQGTFTW